VREPPAQDPTAAHEEAPARAPEEPPAASPAAPAARDLDAVTELWPAVVDLVRGENALLGALIAEARPVAAQGEELVLAFAATAQFLKKKAEDPANRMAVGEALRAVTGTRWRLSYELREHAAGGEAGESSEQSEEDWVRRLMDEFDAEEIHEDWQAEPGAGAQDAEPGPRAATSNEKGA
jgi:hypothetical protein